MEKKERGGFKHFLSEIWPSIERLIIQSVKEIGFTVLLIIAAIVIAGFAALIGFGR